MHCHHTSLPVDHPTWKKMNGDQSNKQHPTDERLTAGFLKLNSLQSLQVDPSSDNARRNFINHLRVPQMSNLDGDSVSVYQATKDTDVFTTNSLQAGGVGLSSLRDPMLLTNIMPTGSNIEGSSRVTTQGSQAQGSSRKRLQVSGSSSILGHSTRDVHHFMSDPLVSSEMIDGSFLTLGVGRDRDPSSRNMFSTQELASKLEAVHPQTYRSIQNNTPNFQNTSNLGVNISTFQSNANKFSSGSYNSGGWNSSCNSDGVNTGAWTGFNSTPRHGLPVSQADVQHDLGVNTSNSGIFPERLSYGGIKGYQAPSSLPFNRNPSYVSHFGSSQISGLGSAPARPAYIATQPNPNHDQNSRPQSLSEYLTYSHPGRLGGPSINQQHTRPFPVGKLASAHNVDSMQALSRSFPGRVEVQGMQATGSSFPKRLGVQSNDSTTQAVPAGEVNQAQSSASVQLPVNLHGTSFALGLPEGRMPAQNYSDLPRTGQVPNMVKADTTPATSFLGRPSVKRRVTVPPPVASSAQRRKITLPPFNQHAVSYIRQNTPASSSIPPASSAIPVPSHPLHVQVPPSASTHIRPKGGRKPLQPLGHKCHLCKRDLSFTPEGPISQPDLPPPVAVLPCGHTFHDHCLQIITPKDQTKEPPCIPCAIGGT